MGATTRNDTAFVLAGGGSLGAVQVGMLKALIGGGVAPDLIVGSSVGAINGAYFAGQPDLDGLKRLEAIWLRMRQRDVFPISLLGGLRVLLGKQNYAVDSGALAGLIAQAVTFKRLEDARIPFHVMATDLYDGSEVCLSEGSTEKALLASSAIPGVYPPVQYGDRYLVDGGVNDHTPISTAIRFGAKRVVVLTTGVSCAITQPPRSVVSMALHAFNLMVMQQLAREAEYFSDQAEVIVVPTLCPVEVTPYDFSQTASLIRRAEESTERWLAAAGLRTGGVRDLLMPHHHDG